MSTIEPSLEFFLWNPISMCSFKLWSIVLLFCRLYLINSPVVRAENLRFKEEGVRDILKDVFLPWYNAYRFLVQNVQILQHKVQLWGLRARTCCFFRVQGNQHCREIQTEGRSGLWRLCDLYLLRLSSNRLYIILAPNLLFAVCTMLYKAVITCIFLFLTKLIKHKGEEEGKGLPRHDSSYFSDQNVVASLLLHICGMLLLHSDLWNWSSRPGVCGVRTHWAITCCSSPPGNTS